MHNYCCSVRETKNNPPKIENMMTMMRKFERVLRENILIFRIDFADKQCFYIFFLISGDVASGYLADLPWDS
jgi:hypothetical protein